MSADWPSPFLLTAEELSALRLSLKVGLWSVALILVPGIFAGWLLAKRQFWGKTLVDGIFHLPLVMPPVVTGYLLLLLLGVHGPIGSWLHEHFGITLGFTLEGAVITTAIMGFPLMVRAVRLSMASVETRLEQAAGSLGANPLVVFLTITLPLSSPGIITGMILAFARSLGEFGATITFVGNIEGETRTLPLAIYTYTQVPDGEDPAMRLLIISVVLALSALLLSEVLARKTERRLGR